MMNGPDRDELPVVAAFGDDLERAIAAQAGAVRVAPRRTLAIVGAVVLVAASLLTAPGRAATGWVGELFGIGEPGGHPTLGDRYYPDEKLSKSIVFAAGHAPDGARYEVVLDRFAGKAKESPPGEVFNLCLDIEWPGIAHEGRSGSCGPVFPPAVVSKAPIGRYISGPESLAHATRYLVVNGFTRSDVSRVRVEFTDKAGRRRAAPVDYVRVAGRLQRRLSADKPFGFYVAFLPPSFPRYIGALPRYDHLPHCPDAYRRRAFDLIAYDKHGKEMKRATRDNSTSGRVAC